MTFTNPCRILSLLCRNIVIVCNQGTAEKQLSIADVVILVEKSQKKKIYIGTLTQKSWLYPADSPKLEEAI